jgi:copper chaperone
MTTLKLAIEGMSCGHCLNAVNRSLAGLAGVKIKSVAVGRAELEFDPAVMDSPRIIAAIDDAGYRATPIA